MEQDSQQLSKSSYALRRKELLTLLKQLRATGAQGELDLPRITVIGNQSAGKSSVVEAISGITVPRDAGTCTRCPMECRLSSSVNAWTCQISIRREYDASGNVLDKVSETPFGHIITDKKNVELALRRAQVAVLNPHVDPSDILKASADSLTKAPFVSQKSSDFSRDTICIDLEGPDLTDLSFVDLPGLIQNAATKTIKLVEDMVISHIKGNCLILVALPMTDDIENQKALRLAKQEDPNGSRTIGVVTKPDMLTAGSTKAREIWLDIIEGRRHPLVHGYYCTRQPDDAERTANITPIEARTAEAQFFGSTHPWSSSAFKDRFGTNNLVASLSKLLVGIINDTLPRIINETATKLETCNHELSKLPKAITVDPATHMLTLVTEFCGYVRRAVDTGIDAHLLIRQNKDTFEKFKTTIRQSAPNFIPVVRDVDGANGSNKRAAGGNATQVDGLTKAKAFYLCDMHKYIQESITRELPNNVPFAAKAELIAQFQNGWRPAIVVCFDAVKEQMKGILEEHIAETFSRYDTLENNIRIHVTEIVDKCYAECASILEDILLSEATPATLNTHYLDTSQAKWLALYKEARSAAKDKEHRRKRVKTTTTAPSKAPFTFASFGQASSGQAPFGQAPSSPAPSSPGPFSKLGPFSQASSSQAPFGQAPFDPSPFGKTPFGQAPLSNGGSAKPPSSSPTTLTQEPAESDDDDVIEISNPSGADKAALVNNALASLTALGYRGLTVESLGKLLPPDEYETELEVMAEVRGYFQVTYKRIIDIIPLMIDYKFVRAVAAEMQSFLIAKLALGTADSSERCAFYLRENPMVVAKRKEFTARKERLEEVKRALYMFGLS